MRTLSALFLALLAASMIGCGSGTTPANNESSTTGGNTAATPANRESQLVGTWMLDVDAVKFEPSEATKAELAKQPLGEGAVAELEKQMKSQLDEQLGTGTWEFKADKTVEVKTKKETATGTWSISGSDVTFKTDKGPETKMTLSEDGKGLVARQEQAQGTIVLALKKS